MTALLSLILVLCLSLVADSAKLREPLAAPRGADAQLLPIASSLA
jgi:hypothetical protein